MRMLKSHEMRTWKTGQELLPFLMGEMVILTNPPVLTWPDAPTWMPVHQGVISCR